MLSWLVLNSADRPTLPELAFTYLEKVPDEIIGLSRGVLGLVVKQVSQVSYRELQRLIRISMQYW
jgi:hypothetical protein